MGRRLIVRVVARGLRGGISDDQMLAVLAARFSYRDVGWRWEVIGDAHLLNDRRQVRRDYKAWRQGA